MDYSWTGILFLCKSLSKHRNDYKTVGVHLANSQVDGKHELELIIMHGITFPKTLLGQISSVALGK